MEGCSYLAAKTTTSKKAATVPGNLADWKPGFKDEAQARALLQELPIKHVNEKENLRLQYTESYFKWLWHLKQGFSLLFYGFGSKRALLESFANEAFLDGGVLAVNGYANGLTIRLLLQRVAKALRLPAGRSSDPSSLLQAIRDAPSEQPLYLIIHNIEGPGLRQAGAQSLLSELAACKCMHVVASMDHVNTPLLWEKQVAARFNWLFYNATTYAHYGPEVSHLQSLLTNQREARIMQGAATVLRTLVPNARQIFRVLAEQQLEDDDEYEGLDFSHLYRLCRERFLVGNEMALRSHLTEFCDHQIVATRRGRDGGDVLYLPMDNETLRQVLADLELATSA